jgi:hypothetical protein
LNRVIALRGNDGGATQESYRPYTKPGVYVPTTVPVYNLWRPVTAIRNADTTSNPATPRDASWLPLGETPMHPEYPCAHCIGSAAVGAVLQKFVGNEFGEFSLTSSTAPGVTRKWTRVQEYSDEVANARIYAGFHYRFSTEVGKDMGRKIGELTAATQLRSVEALAKPAR